MDLSGMVVGCSKSPQPCSVVFQVPFVRHLSVEFTMPDGRCAVTPVTCLFRREARGDGSARVPGAAPTSRRYTRP